MTRSRVEKFSYALGLLTALAIGMLAFLFVAIRFGLWHTADTVANAVTFSVVDDDHNRADVPPSVLHDELAAIGAVAENVYNFMGSKRHDNFLVRPDPELQYVLRPSVSVSAYLLKTKHDLNLDPPVLYFPAGASMSAGLTAYLQAEARISYSFSTNTAGLRTTTPDVAASRQVLMIGDSVAFGIGVGDDLTMASQLQRQLGTSIRVVNAAVGGYDEAEILEVARRLAKQRTYEALVYVGCLNDFDWSTKEHFVSSARAFLTKLQELKPRFSNRVIVMMQSYLEHTARDVLGRAGWPDRELDATDHLLAALPAVTKELGFQYVDWTQLLSQEVEKRGTVFARFAFYFDHAHFSPVGHRLAANALQGALQTLGVSDR